MTAAVYERADVLARYWKFSLDDPLFVRVELNLEYRESRTRYVGKDALERFASDYRLGRVPPPEAVFVGWYFSNDSGTVTACTERFVMPPGEFLATVRRIVDLTPAHETN